MSTVSKVNQVVILGFDNSITDGRAVTLANIKGIGVMVLVVITIQIDSDLLLRDRMAMLVD
ncbi:uncharacterized protein N7482_001989 [Penicillium canariense]|uniref:Uncharacterized protein n=1 Tax=Penicillium canariense TaxID=189055 RepID=A0A9W9IGT8_9EURO|nr:uncharacterized protein N7482_001989 [Penicillium canariense]KAJ5176112.1 hypothetical protein N7482_001989 [Penicillium canariense]